jgi:prepilin-type N-terminal cleavage/methylation domain-containing protein
MEGKENMRTLKTGIWNNERGFTFIELSMVLIIIGVVSVLAVPRLKNLMWHGDVKAAVRRLSGAIRYTHNQTAMTKSRHRIMYDLDNSRYWIVIRDENGNFVEDRSVITRKMTLPDKVRIKDVFTQREGEVIHGITYTEFVPNGLVEDTVIHIENDEGRVFTMIIKPLTGDLKVYDRYIKVRN